MNTPSRLRSSYQRLTPEIMAQSINQIVRLKSQDLWQPNSQEQALARTNPTSPATIDVLQRFGSNPEKLLIVFNPSNQDYFCSDLDRVYFGKAPTIKAVSDAYGPEIVESWLICQLNDLSENAGSKQQFTPRQIEELARRLARVYPGYKLTEFMLFFQQFKDCRFGYFYNIDNPMKVMDAAAQFDRERTQAYAKREQDEELAKRERDRKQFAELRQRYIDRIPDAFTPKAPMDFLQYRLLGYNEMSDEELSAELAAITSGEKKIPYTFKEILDYFRKQEAAQ